MRKFIGGVVLAFIGLIMLGMIIGGAPPDHSIAPSVSATSGVTPAPIAKKWQYEVSKDELTDKVWKMACLDSSNQVEFGFPYGGGSTAELCFRRGSKKTDGFLRVDKGQFLCSFEGCTVKARVGDGPVQSFGMLDAKDGSANIIFFSAAPILMKRLAAGQRLRLSAEFYQEGDRTFDFDPKGLDSKQLN